MIVADRKPVDEIASSLAGYRKVVIASCGTCVTVCMAGGEKEARELAAVLSLADEASGVERSYELVDVKRQCDDEFFDGLESAFESADAVLSLGCGAGVQFMAERFPSLPIIPGLDTKFMGASRGLGYWVEMCQGCGDCILERTGGVCPVTRCSKSNFNGPCGGSQAGKCEVDPSIDCGWQLIYDRLKAIGRLGNLEEIVEPRDWSSSRDGGPRTSRNEQAELAGGTLAGSAGKDPGDARR